MGWRNRVRDAITQGMRELEEAAAAVDRPASKPDGTEILLRLNDAQKNITGAISEYLESCGGSHLVAGLDDPKDD